jgi:hypothetical protein
MDEWQDRPNGRARRNHLGGRDDFVTRTQQLFVSYTQTGAARLVSAERNGLMRLTLAGIGPAKPTDAGRRRLACRRF